MRFLLCRVEMKLQRMIDMIKLPKHECSLSIDHNPHKGAYQTIEKYIEISGDLFDWESDEHKRRSIDTNEIWTIQWYPSTPVGFYCVAAPTLDELLHYVNSIEWE